MHSAKASGGSALAVGRVLDQGDRGSISSTDPGVLPPSEEFQSRVWLSSRLEASEGNLVWSRCREVLQDASGDNAR